MRYMVCRKDAVHGGMKSSELFPVIVDAPLDATWEAVVLQALHEKWPNYTPKDKSYYVVPLDGARIVTFRPKVDYEIVVDRV